MFLDPPFVLRPPLRFADFELEGGSKNKRVLCCGGIGTRGAGAGKGRRRGKREKEEERKGEGAREARQIQCRKAWEGRRRAKRS